MTIELRCPHCGEPIILLVEESDDERLEDVPTDEPPIHVYRPAPTATDAWGPWERVEPEPPAV